ncbi:MAG: RluA family pseudouridine synthase [Patescibacteria group bacterium]
MSLDPKRILYQDEDFLAVHKLSGELVVRGKGPVGKLPLLDFLKKEYPGLRAVHRLDFETSGVVLFARTKRGLEALAPMKGDGRTSGPVIEKTYASLVTGTMKPREGTIAKPLPAHAGGDLVPAATRYRVLQQFETVSYIEAAITKGRHHQIRRHFAGTGHPLILDEAYGNEKANAAFSRAFRYRKFFLHARRISFIHPFTSQKLVIEAPLPNAFQEVLTKLKNL